MRFCGSHIDEETMNPEMRKWVAAGHQHAMNIHRY
jgi:hypothetical protein